MRFNILLAVGAICCGATSTPAEPKCLAGLATNLRAAGFSGSLDCKRDHLKMRSVGKIDVMGYDFTIYDYRYQLAPACPECAVHGGQRIIVLRDGKYIGQYKPEFAYIRVAAGNLILVPEERGSPPRLNQKIKIRFGPEGPPSRVWFDGDDLVFFR